MRDHSFLYELTRKNIHKFLYSIILLVLFLLVFGVISYQEIRYRRIQHYLVISLCVLGVIHLGISSHDSFMFAGIVTILLGVVRLGGMFKTSDWLCCSALFTFLLPFGIHVAVFSVLLGFAVSVSNHLLVCVVSNLSCRGIFPGVQATRGTRLLAMISCKRRGVIDRFAYPAVLIRDGVMSFDINSGIRAKKLDYARKCPYVIPSIPILTFMCASLLFVSLVLFPQNIF